MSTVILVATALATLGLIEALYNGLRYSSERKRTELRRRLRSTQQAGITNLLRERRVAKSPELERMLLTFPFVTDLERLLMQSNLSWTVAGMLGAAITAAAALGSSITLLLNYPVYLALIAVVASFAAPVLIAFVSRNRRSSQISEQLPEALDMMVRSLRAGHGLSAAFKLVATEMPPPIAIEFARCFEEINMGVEFRDAVTNMTERVPGNLDLRIFAVSVVLQHETGGNLVDILEQISGTIRERFKFKGKLAALTAEIKLSGLVLGALPPIVVLILIAGNRNYMSVLVTDPAGPYFIAAGVLQWAIGLFTMFKLSEVKY